MKGSQGLSLILIHPHIKSRFAPCRTKRNARLSKPPVSPCGGHSVHLRYVSQQSRGDALCVRCSSQFPCRFNFVADLCNRMFGYRSVTMGRETHYSPYKAVEAVLMGYVGKSDTTRYRAAKGLLWTVYLGS